MIVDGIYITDKMKCRDCAARFRTVKDKDGKWRFEEKYPLLSGECGCYNRTNYKRIEQKRPVQVFDFDDYDCPGYYNVDKAFAKFDKMKCRDCAARFRPVQDKDGKWRYEEIEPLFGGECGYYNRASDKRIGQHRPAQVFDFDDYDCPGYSNVDEVFANFVKRPYNNTGIH